MSTPLKLALIEGSIHYEKLHKEKMEHLRAWGLAYGLYYAALFSFRQRKQVETLSIQWCHLWLLVCEHQAKGTWKNKETRDAFWKIHQHVLKHTTADTFYSHLHDFIHASQNNSSFPDDSIPSV